jgi:hypothetical protein
MTDRTRGTGIGKLVVGFIGMLAMATIVTGAVAASSAPSRLAQGKPAVATDPASTNAPTAHLSSAPRVKDTDKPSHAPTSAPTSAPTTQPIAGATCDPALDKAEDQAERLARASAEAAEGLSESAEHQPGGSLVPEPSKAPGTPEPSKCNPAGANADVYGNGRGTGSGYNK